MRHEQMPDHRLKRFAVRRDVSRVDRRHDDARRRFLRGVTAVASNDADNRGANLPGELNCADQVGTDVFLQVAAADGKNEQAVLCVQPAAFEPLGKNRGPAFVVGAGSQFRNVVGLDNAREKRAFEYLAWRDGLQNPGGPATAGTRLPEFLNKDVMPVIESRYRIAKGRENTGVGGSSYGGVAALYVGIDIPLVFGKVLRSEERRVG